MPYDREFILGEHKRTLDDRFRLSLPAEFADLLAADGEECILAKERAGCLSLWNAGAWKSRLEGGVGLVQAKMQSGRLDGKLDEVQLLGRLLSTRHKHVSLAGRGRLVVPEGFREFLAVEPGGEVFIVGAAVCIEIWKPTAWINYLQERMPEFSKLLEGLAS